MALASVLAILGAVPGHGAEAARPGIADRCSGADCPAPPARGVTVYRGLVLDYEVIDGMAVHGGDMVLGTAAEAASAAPAREPSERERSEGPARRDAYSVTGSALVFWPGGRVPYEIDERIKGEDLERIHAALEEWNSKTVIFFFPRTDEEDYALLVPRNGGPCRSVLGRHSPTTVWTGGCGLSATIHELGHAVGLMHEHQRPDRDRFIAVPAHALVGDPFSSLWTTHNWHSPQHLTGPYDYRSIMNYWSTLVTSVPRGIGSGDGTLSAGDIDGVARLYRQAPAAVTVSTNPPGLAVLVDGASVTTPAAFEWLPGSVHALEAPVLDHLDSRPLVFGRWNDDGARKRTVEVADSTWFEANYIQLARVRDELPRPGAVGEGSSDPQRFKLYTPGEDFGEIEVSPESEDGFYASGSQVQLRAIPEEGRYFVGWEHDLAGTETTRTVIMDRDRHVGALFSYIKPELVRFGEPLHFEFGDPPFYGTQPFVRVPDGTSEVAVRFESSAAMPAAEFYVTAHSDYRRTTGILSLTGSLYELGSTRLGRSDTITLTREGLNRMWANARLSPVRDHHLGIVQRRSAAGWSGKLHVTLQRDWIAGVWPPMFTFVSSAGWSSPLRQTLRVAPVEGEIPHVRYRIVSNRHWLDAYPPEWTSAQGEAEIAVTANGAALGAEAYGGKLKIQILRDGDPAAGWTPTGIEIPVHFVVTSPAGDDHGDTRSAATEIAAGASAQGRLQVVGDEDWFRFQTTAAHTWVTVRTVSEGDTDGELHMAGGDKVADDDSGSGGNFQITASVPAGTHFVRVSAFGAADYTLTLEAVPDDHGDTRSAATEVAVGDSAQGRLQVVGDEDWFQFRTTAARTWITASTAEDTVVEFRAAEARWGEDYDTFESWRMHGRETASLPAGTHYVRVTGSGTADYTLTLGETLDAMEFVRIPAGTFVMGSPDEEDGGYDEGQHWVQISQEVWMGKYEVTLAEWLAATGESTNRWQYRHHPVERKTWEDVQEFIRKLNERQSGSGYVYRLPTEAEWEYAARAGATGARYGELDEIAWWDGNNGFRVGPNQVGLKRANAWGLHDMLGNVAEWTGDWYGPYPSGFAIDPHGPSTGSHRVYRGGSVSAGHRTEDIRFAERGSTLPSYAGFWLGFRLVRTQAGGSSGVAAEDDHGDAWEDATEVAVGDSAQGRIERVGDEDWFRFRTTAAHTLIKAHAVAEGYTPAELHVAGSDSPLADDDAGIGGDFRIAAVVPAGTHYLRVSGGIADYTYTLTREESTEIAAGDSVRGRIERIGDEDWFRFRTTAARTVITAYTESEGYTAGELHVAGSHSPVTDDGAGIGGNFRIEAVFPAGTHYLRVSGSGTADYTLTLEEATEFEFVRIPAGSFVMGAPEDEEGRQSNEGPQREVTLSQGFWMGKYEVTQGEWEGVMGENPSWHRYACSSVRCPVQWISWDDVQEFLRKLNEREAESGYVYRLPTEAEWEYAARAGTTGARYGELDEIAWWDGNSGDRPHPVGGKRANAWGLHDMLGNVREWVADWYGDYPSGAVTDPLGPGTGSYRVIRGGAFGADAIFVRSAYRRALDPGDKRNDIGFRLVRTE